VDECKPLLHGAGGLAPGEVEGGRMSRVGTSDPCNMFLVTCNGITPSQCFCTRSNITCYVMLCVTWITGRDRLISFATPSFIALNSEQG